MPPGPNAAMLAGTSARTSCRPDGEGDAVGAGDLAEWAGDGCVPGRLPGAAQDEQDAAGQGDREQRRSKGQPHGLMPISESQPDPPGCLSGDDRSWLAGRDGRWWLGDRDWAGWF